MVLFGVWEGSWVRKNMLVVYFDKLGVLENFYVKEVVKLSFGEGEVFLKVVVSVLNWVDLI